MADSLDEAKAAFRGAGSVRYRRKRTRYAQVEHSEHMTRTGLAARWDCLRTIAQASVHSGLDTLYFALVVE